MTLAQATSDFATLSVAEIIIRLAIAALLGALVGLEREFSDQPAGFRTHILVSLGAALFTLVGAYGLGDFSGEGEEIVRDPTRVAAQIVTGIGFLGAGAILRQGVNVRGLTTAAALWVTAAIGTAVALGFWEGAVATAGITVTALYGLKRLERVIFPRFRQGYYRFEIEMEARMHLDELEEKFERVGALVYSMKILTDDEGNRHLVARVHLPSGAQPDAIAQTLRDVRGVRNVAWDG